MRQTTQEYSCLKGIGAVNTPPMFGGDKDEAIEAFDKAIIAFSNDEYSSYHWGYAEAYTWRGLLMQQRGETKKAVTDWNEALKVDPDYGWAKSLLAGIGG